MSLRTKKWSYARAFLVLVAAVPVIGGGTCTRTAQDYVRVGPGDVEPGGNCEIPASMSVNENMFVPMDPVCADNPEDTPTFPCQCQDFEGSLPPGVVLPLEDNPRGCHRDAFNRGIKYILPDCAHIAEVSGRVTRYFPFASNPDEDDDRSLEICPDRQTMRVDPFAKGASKELRTMGSIVQPPGSTHQPLKGSIHLEVQDCRWYDGVFFIPRENLSVTLFGDALGFNSRPDPYDMFSTAGDWIADFNHLEDTPETAIMEIHEARAIAVVKPVNDTIAVALTNAFFALETHQATKIQLGIKMPPKPTDLKHWTLNCRILEDNEFLAIPSCSSKPNLDPNIEPIGDGEDRCNVLINRNDAVQPLPFQCTDTCGSRPYNYSETTAAANCDNIHFMNPVVGEWVDPADLWSCQCPCDDPSAPGAIIEAPVQGCAQINLDPSKPEDQAIACAQVCGGQICGVAPACRIGECHAPASGGAAQLIARGVCDPANPQPITRVSAAGDYHVTIDHNASSIELHVDDQIATSTLDGTLHFNLNEVGGIRVVDFADARSFPDDFSLSIFNVTNATVVSSSRVLGQFGTGTTFQIPADSGSFAAQSIVLEKSFGEELRNPDPVTGTINVQTREFALDVFAEEPPEEGDANGSVQGEENNKSLVAHIVGTIDNIPPVAVSGGPTRTIECNSKTLTPVTLNGTQSYDPDPGDSISHYQWFTAAGAGMGNQAVVSTSVPLGHSGFVLHVYDADLGSAAAPLDINVVDSTGPTLTLSLQETCMWPSDHKRVRFRLGTDVTATATDTCDGAPTVRIVNVTSSQPENIFGDGNTVNDATFSDHAFCLRRERTPQLGERIYWVTIEARDASGNATTQVLPVHVAANNKGKSCPSIGTVIADGAPCE